MVPGRTVFRHDRLVLLWPFGPADRTVEGVGLGTSVYEAWLAYPDAEALRPAPDARSDALLVRRTGRGYLMRHDGAVVREMYAGTEDLLRATYHAN
ncbi:hypothetical protein [Actinocatenispora rupis]|nr:hypothetical protein [Actinocatenispora rupis]